MKRSTMFKYFSNYPIKFGVGKCQTHSIKYGKEYSSVHFSINMFMIILISRNYVHCVALFWSIHLDMQCINYSAGSLLLLQTRARNVQIFWIHRKKMRNTRRCYRSLCSMYKRIGANKRKNFISKGLDAMQNK